MPRYLEVLGFRFGNVAYLTDYNIIPAESYTLLRNLDVVFLDALRHVDHPTHMTVAEALNEVEKIRPRQAFFTHGVDVDDKFDGVADVERGEKRDGLGEGDPDNDLFPLRREDRE